MKITSTRELPMTELTLHLNPELFEKVNHWAESKGISVNEAIAVLIEQLPSSDVLPSLTLELTPWTQSLVSVLNLEGQSLDDEILHQQYLDYLEEKYQCAISEGCQEIY